MTMIDAIAGVAKRGTLYGIGVGPGDVRYLTLRAVGVLRSVDVIGYFAKNGHDGTITIARVTYEGMLAVTGAWTRSAIPSPPASATRAPTAAACLPLAGPAPASSSGTQAPSRKLKAERAWSST